jgi:hypothetical protein
MLKGIQTGDVNDTIKNKLKRDIQLTMQDYIL